MRLCMLKQRHDVNLPYNVKDDNEAQSQRPPETLQIYAAILRFIFCLLSRLHFRFLADFSINKCWKIITIATIITENTHALRITWLHTLLKYFDVETVSEKYFDI